MPRQKLVIVLCLLITGGWVLAQQTPKPAGQEPRPDNARRQERNERLAKQLVALFDQDADGQLSKQEFKGPSLAFRRLDQNRDGVLTKEELESMQGGQAIYQGPLTRFLMMDEDADGKISRSELTGPLARLDFSAVDSNSDGYLTVEEVREFQIRERSRQIADFIRQHDNNKDGQVTRQEFQGAPQQFDLMDADMDAVVTQKDVDTRENKYFLAPQARARKN